MVTPPDMLKVAIYQAAPVPLAISGGIDKVVRLARGTAERIAIFLGMAISVGIQIFDNATDVDAPLTQALIHIPIYLLPCIAFTWFLNWSLNEKLSSWSEAIE
ncbi:hypothetical protein CP97_07825 [Aurantiacibacter atlanticus]|uniref:Uncharacterized protein n=1 Tax=Aurantiacibacter atlanticus TaxID=1648404 RepID=A0A0H4VFR7_9SPHN|nr:hypothetical protein [Aurantiacibacter atlanticus]AKQ41954.1 hypothetical protein CP97_07825 [Aurantiacibacter atlanticus]